MTFAKGWKKSGTGAAADWFLKSLGRFSNGKDVLSSQGSTGEKAKRCGLGNPVEIFGIC